MNNLPKARTENLIVQKAENELLIYDLASNKVCCLNRSSEVIWNLCDGTKPICVIADETGKKLKAAVSENLGILKITNYWKIRI